MIATTMSNIKSRKNLEKFNKNRKYLRNDSRFENSNKFS